MEQCHWYINFSLLIIFQKLTINVTNNNVLIFSSIYCTTHGLGLVNDDQFMKITFAAND